MRWFWLTFLISAWMFVLGIFVGRGTVPVKFDVEKLETELAALKKAFTQMEYRRFLSNSEEGPVKQDLDFYEALKENSTLAPPKKDPVKSVPAAAPKTALAPKSDAPKPEVAPIVQTPEAPAKALPPKTADSRKNMTIQVAASRDAKVADRLVDSLKKKGYPAYRAIGKVPGQGIWYRVRIGYYADRQEASSTLSRLQQDNFKAILVTR